MSIDGEQSEWNAAYAKLTRIQLIFATALDAKNDKDMPLWAEMLGHLYLELSSWMNDKERQESYTELKSITAQANRHQNSKPGLRKTISPELYWRLFALDEKLRITYKNKGFEGQSRDPGSALGRGQA